MKNRLLWLFATIVALSAIALVWVSQQKGRVAPHPEVAIQDGKTIDFSSGKPVVKDAEKEKAALAKGVKEINAAQKGVIFGSPKPAEKKAEPAKNP
jgi:hypothetical protein